MKAIEDKQKPSDLICHWCNKSEKPDGDKKWFCFPRPEKKYSESCTRFDQMMCSTAKCLG